MRFDGRSAVSDFASAAPSISRVVHDDEVRTSTYSMSKQQTQSKSVLH